MAAGDFTRHLVVFTPTGSDAMTRQSRNTVVHMRADAAGATAAAADAALLTEARALYGDGTLTAVAGPQVVPTWARPGNCFWSGTAIVESPVAVRAAADIRRDAVAHARSCLDLMKPIWITNADGSASVVSDTRGTKGNQWWNTRGWLMSPLAIIDALLDASREQDADNCLTAYRSLVPSIESQISFWYWNHTVAIWSAYFPRRVAPTDTNPGMLRPYMRWLPTDTSHTPTFASDAGTATPWDGTGGTISIWFSEIASPESFTT